MQCSCGSRDHTYPLLSGIGNVLVGLEERADVDGLSSPEMPVNRPIKGKLQRPPVERSARMGQSGDPKLETMADESPSQSSLPRRHDGQSVCIPRKKVPQGEWQVVGGEETRYWGREGRDALGIRLPCQAANWAGHGPLGGNEVSRGVRIWSSGLCVKGEWTARRTAVNLVAGKTVVVDYNCQLLGLGLLMPQLLGLRAGEKTGPCSLVIGTEGVLIG